MPIIFSQRQFRAVFLIAYPPMSCGFISRIRGLPKKLGKSQQLLIWSISQIVISLTIFFITLLQIGPSAFSNDTQLKKAEITLSIRADPKWIFDEIWASLMDVK